MHICIVGPSKRFLSGISYYTIRLANALSTSTNVSVICFRKLLPEFLFPGKKHIGKNITKLSFLPKVMVFEGMDYNNPLTWYRAYRYLKTIKPEIIIMQWWTSSVSHMHLLLKLMGNMIDSKLIIEFHEVIDPLEDSILPLRIYSCVIGKLLRRNVNAYIVHSNSDKLLVAERYGINPNKIHVIPHGLYDHYKKLEHNKAKKILNIKEDYVILYFGLIRKYKGVEYLIKAFEEFPKHIMKKTRLLIVGEIWEEKDKLLRTINLSPYKENITLVDKYVPDEIVSIYFSASNIVVLPYTRASQSGIAHIAMCFGKTIIASKVGGLKESLQKYDGAFFVPPKNSHALAEELLKHLKTQKIYNTPALGWDIIKRKYFEVISKL